MRRQTYTISIKFSLHIYKDRGCNCICSRSCTLITFRQSGGQCWKTNRNILYVPPPPKKKESNCVRSGTGGGQMTGPSLPTHFGGNFRSKKSHTSKCTTAEMLRFAGLAFLIRAIFQNAAYEIPAAYLGTLHQSYCFRQKRKVQALTPFLSFCIEHKRHLNLDIRL